MILSRVTNDMLLSSRRNSGNLRLVLKSLVSSRIVAFGCEIMSEEKNRGVDPKGEEVFFRFPPFWGKEMVAACPRYNSKDVCSECGCWIN